MVEKRKNNKYNSYYNTTIGVKAMNKDSQKPTLTIKGYLRLYLLYGLYLLFFLSYRAELDSLFVSFELFVFLKNSSSRAELDSTFVSFELFVFLKSSSSRAELGSTFMSFELFVFFKSQAGCIISPTD